MDNCTSEFNVLASSEDGTAESISHKKQNSRHYVSIQNEDPFQAHDLNLFSSFINGEKL